MRQGAMAFALLLLGCTNAWAQGDEQSRTLGELKARLYAPATPEQKLREHLAQLEKQTGSALADRRSKADDPLIALPQKPRTYWQTAQDLSEALKCRISLFEGNGPALIDGTPAKQQSVVLDGIVRISVRRWMVQRDEETGTHVAAVTLDVAWEPGFEPFYLEVRPAHAKAEKATFDIAGQGKESIAHRRATEITLRMPAPPRSVRQIDVLEGELRILGPSKMLDFVFPDASVAKSLTREGVTVGIKPGTRNRWAFDVAIQNPPGGPVFESFQSWLDHNRIQLERTQAGKAETWRPDPNAEELVGMLTAENAAIRYVFEGTQGKGTPRQWALRYRTPGRMVELPVRYRFTNLELP
ncbi:MAG: hypothetical protein K2X38_17225 [Gemmataceae bacterium]|nr:hypothetical protein [Gemmataceae bacterium]